MNLTYSEQSAVNAFVTTDRQWKRQHRLSHAFYQRNKATTQKDRRFWQGVILKLSLNEGAQR